MPFIYAQKPSSKLRCSCGEPERLTLTWKSGITTLLLDQQKAPGQRKSAGQPKPILLPPEHTRLMLSLERTQLSHISCHLGGWRGEREESWKIRNREHRCLHGEHYCSLCDPWPITKAMHFRTTLTLSINSGSSAVLLSSRSNIYEGFRRCKINLILSV